MRDERCERGGGFALSISLTSRARLCFAHALLSRAFPHAPPPAQILHLRGLKYLYRLNLFMYSLVGVMAATAALLAFQGAAKWVKPAGKAKRGGR